MQEELYLEVSGVEHVLDDHHSLVSLTHFSFLLRSPVQLPANTSTQNQINWEERDSSSCRNDIICRMKKERNKENGTSAAAAVFCDTLCSSFSSYWRHTGLSAQNELLQRAAGNLGSHTHPANAQPELLTLSKHTHTNTN